MWKPVLGYESLYDINEAGDIRRLAGFWCKRTRPVRWLPDHKTHAQRVALYDHGQETKKRFLVHRLVWEAFNGPIPKGLTINHLDGNRENNHLSNLETATMREQMVHAYATGLQKRAKGEDRGAAAKLNN